MNLFANGVTELRRFADYRGRSTRTDMVAFWLVTFTAGLAFLVITIILKLAVFPDPSLTGVVQLACQWLLTIPLVALFVRRLHDRGLSGWWVALCVPAAAQNIVADYYRLTGDFESMLAVKYSTSHLIAGLALLVLFIFLLLPGEEGPNLYGPDPRYESPGEPA